MHSSKYNIYIKLHKNSEYYFIVHGYSGAMDLIKKSYVDSLRKAKHVDLIHEIDSETFIQLKDRGYITDKSEKEERDVIEKIVGFIQKKNLEKKTNSFLFVVTENCNFRCSYCFENSFSDYGLKWSEKTFTKELVDKAYSAMLKIQPDRTKHNNSIGLYGGEPLLSKNYEIVEYIVKQGIIKGYNFLAITNGYDLDSYFDLLGKDKIEFLQITIDGLKNIHDSRRKHYSNNGSFLKITENIDKALLKDVRISVRINIDNSNFDQIERLFSFFNDKKWLEKNNFSYYAAPVYSDCHLVESNESSSKLSSLIQRINILKDNNKQLGDTIGDLSAIDKLLDNSIGKGNMLSYKSTFCSAHNGMLLFNSDGKIYPCWEVVGNSKHMVAEFNEDLIINKEYNKWNNRNVLSIESCYKCKYALFCSGGCAGKLVNQDKEIYNSNCQDFPKIFANMVNSYYDKNLKDKTNPTI